MQVKIYEVRADARTGVACVVSVDPDGNTMISAPGIPEGIIVTKRGNVTIHTSVADLPGLPEMLVTLTISRD